MIKLEDIKKAIEKNKKKIGIREIKSLKVSRIGMGENNLNFLVSVKGEKFVFRVALRKFIEKNMEKEFNALKDIPKGFGPEPVYFDKTKKIIPKYYSVLRYIEGKHPKKWGKKELRMHAEKLADLHKDRKRYWTWKGRKQTAKFDIYKLFLEEVKGYKKDSPEIFDSEVNELIAKVKKHLKEKNHLFTALKRFSRVHKDPCITNILFTDKGVRYIDWEWTGYWDNALDVAMLFDTVYAQPPWKIKLNGKRLDFYLNSYLKKMKDKTLRERVLAWAVYFRGTDIMFFKWKVMNYEKCDLPKKKYAEDYKKVADSIRKL